LHPDANPSPDAANQFMAIQKAYEVLSNPEKRIDYLISQVSVKAARRLLRNHSFHDSLQVIEEEQYVYALLKI
jgi:DnaJ-class molecular chaperone